MEIKLSPLLLRRVRSGSTEEGVGICCSALRLHLEVVAAGPALRLHAAVAATLLERSSAGPREGAALRWRGILEATSSVGGSRWKDLAVLVTVWS
jgi:hypothetical protein